MKVDYKFEGTKLLITVDGNNDGQPVLSILIDLAEIPDEVMSLLSKK